MAPPLPVMAPEIRAPTSGAVTEGLVFAAVPVIFKAEPLFKVIEPELVTPLCPPPPLAVSVPLIVSTLLAPFSTMLPRLMKPSSLLLVPVMLIVPVVVNVYELLTRNPRVLA